MKDTPFVAEHFSVTYSLHGSQLLVSMGTTNHCTKKILWGELRALLVYGYRITNLRCSLILFNKIIVYLPPGPVYSLIMCFWPDLQ